MESVVDLKPNRALLDPHFECYRLNTTSLEVFETKLQAKVTHAELSADQFGLCHVQLQAKQNALISDDFNVGLSFYTSHGGLYRLKAPHPSFMETSGFTGIPSDCVYKLPNSTTTGSFQFLSETQAVALEPRGNLIVLNTGPRSTTERFEGVFVFESGLHDANILSARKVVLDENKFAFHLLICSVKKDEHKTFTSSSNFKSCLEWMVIEQIDESKKITWNVSRRTELVGKAVPRFTSFVSTGSHHETMRLLVCADCRYKATNGEVKKNTETEDDQSSVPLYSYIQDETEATIIFSLKVDVSKSDIQVTIASKKIQVRIRGETVIDSELHDTVDSACSTWLIMDGKLEITLVKCHPGRWARLLKDDNRGEEIFDAAYVASVHHRLRHLTTDSQNTSCGSSLANPAALEECDEASDEFYMEAFGFESNRIRRLCFSNLTGHQHLMNIISNEGSHLVLRHDVDGLVWKFESSDQESIRACHIHTLNAFGYVAASKRDKVLSIGCLEAGFVALVDSTNNVFIYEQPKLSQLPGEPKKHVLSQYVMRLQDATSPVLGGQMFGDRLLLLTRSTFYVIALPK